MRELFVVMSVMAAGFLSIQSAHEFVHLCLERPGVENVTMDMPVEVSEPQTELHPAQSRKLEVPHRSYEECEFEMRTEFQVREPIEIQAPRRDELDSGWKSLDLAAFPGRQALNSSKTGSNVDLPMIQ